MHISQGIVEFIPQESGLHYLDPKDNEKAGVALVTTIRENFEGYMKKIVEGASMHVVSKQGLDIHPRKTLKS